MSGVTAESLSKVKAAFAKDGTTHAGNASQVSDGAAAVLLARRSTAQKLGLPILAKFVTAAVVGVPRKSDRQPHYFGDPVLSLSNPIANVMGIGPAFAIPKALEKAGISQDEVDLWEM